MPAPSLKTAYGLPPKEALERELARQAGGVQITYDWRDLWGAQHAEAFTVSRLACADLLAALHDGLIKSVAGDTSRRDWMKDAQALLSEAGWWGEKTVIDEHTGEPVTTRFTPARLQLIYDTNVNTAYAAGAAERAQRTKKLLPYLRWVHYKYPDGKRAREEHLKLDGMVLEKDHPFWQKCYPPNGWNCKCMAVSVSRKEFERGMASGKFHGGPADLMQTRPWKNPRTGETRQVPVYAAPGWDYNPASGGARQQEQLDAIGKKLAALPVGIGTAAGKLLREKTVQDAFAQWASAVFASGRAQGARKIMGVMTASEAAAWKAHTGSDASSAALFVEDRLMVGAKAARHQKAGDALSVQEWANLPLALAGGERRAYFDTVKRNFVYVLPSQDNRKIKIAVEVEFIDPKRKDIVNMARSVFKVDDQAFVDRKRYIPVLQ